MPSVGSHQQAGGAPFCISDEFNVPFVPDIQRGLPGSGTAGEVAGRGEVDVGAVRCRAEHALNVRAGGSIGRVVIDGQVGQVFGGDVVAVQVGSRVCRDSRTLPRVRVVGQLGVGDEQDRGAGGGDARFTKPRPRVRIGVDRAFARASLERSRIVDAHVKPAVSVEHRAARVL